MGRKGNSGMSPAGITTSADIDRIKFTRETFNQLGVQLPRYTADYGEVGQAVINKNLDSTYSAMILGGSSGTYYENFDYFNDAKKAVREAAKKVLNSRK